MPWVPTHVDTQRVTTSLEILHLPQGSQGGFPLAASAFKRHRVVLMRHPSPGTSCRRIEAWAQCWFESGFFQLSLLLDRTNHLMHYIFLKRSLHTGNPYLQLQGIWRRGGPAFSESFCLVEWDLCTAKWDGQWGWHSESCSTRPRSRFILRVFFFPLDFMVLFLGSLLYARGKATTISREYVKVIMGN